MTVETFFANFGHLADAPNGVQQLRELILQLAVQGKLVPQDPNDEPASVLLEKIEAERKRLRATEKIKLPKKLKLIDDDEKPTQLPLSWQWVRLEEVFYPVSTGNKKVNTRDILDEGEFPVVDQGQSYIAGYVNDKSKVIHIPGPVVVFGDHTRAVKYVDFDFVGGADGIKVLRPIGIFERYFFKVLEGYDLEGRGYGRHYKILLSNLFPLPPLEEQKRIVAKVDQLMALCDDLEARQQKQQQGRMRLNNAALDAMLTAREPDEFADHWQRISNNFDLLYDHPETIAKLRSAILQLAVQGKLVPQDPNDEPASVLLERIKAEKERLIKEKKIKKAKPVPPVDVRDFEKVLPNGWDVCRFGNLVLEFQNGLSKRGASEGVPVPVLRLADIKNGGLSEDDLRAIPLSPKEIGKYAVEKGDILLIRVNGSGDLVGKFIPCLVSREWAYCDHLIRIRTSREFVSQKYLCILASTAEARLHIIGKTITTAGQKTINQTGVATLPVLLPPLEEQKRIVTKVDQLMALCDELEAKLDQAQQNSEKLMEATVRQLLVA